VAGNNVAGGGGECVSHGKGIRAAQIRWRVTSQLDEVTSSNKAGMGIPGKPARNP
jgi:hypothetical protein